MQEIPVRINTEKIEVLSKNNLILFITMKFWLNEPKYKKNI